MPFHIRDTQTDTLVRRLAIQKGVSLTEAVKIAASNELQRIEEQKRPLHERIAAIQKRALALLPTGEVADKAFFDELSGGL